MAIRKHLSHDTKTREKIQCSQLINRLNKFINGEIELTSQQIKAIEILLKKSLPDLQAISIDADVKSEVIGEVIFRGFND